jgi:hypothetical protein
MADLSELIARMERDGGVFITELSAGTRVTFHTANSTYTLVVCDPAARRVVIQGGRYFPDMAAAVLTGSTFGGSAIRLGWIGVNMHVELWHGTRRITTSPVKTVIVHADQGEGA